jgi:hypothetical protein
MLRNESFVAAPKGDANEPGLNGFDAPDSTIGRSNSEGVISDTAGHAVLQVFGRETRGSPSR